LYSFLEFKYIESYYGLILGLRILKMEVEGYVSVRALVDWSACPRRLNSKTRSSSKWQVRRSVSLKMSHLITCRLFKGECKKHLKPFVTP